MAAIKGIKAAMRVGNLDADKRKKVPKSKARAAQRKKS